MKKNDFNDFSKVAKKAIEMLYKDRFTIYFHYINDNDILLATSHFLFNMSYEIFDVYFKKPDKIGRYENPFKLIECGGDYAIRNNYGTIETEVIEIENIGSIKKIYNTYLTGNIDNEKEFNTVKKTTISIDCGICDDVDVFKAKNQLFCINKHYIDMIESTPYGDYETVTLAEEKRFNPICYRSCYGMVDGLLRYYGFVVLPVNMDAKDILEKILFS